MPGHMTAMVLEHPGAGAHLQARERRVPRPRGHDVLLRVLACGVCRTDLHLLDGELPPHRHALVPGHEIVGEVCALGADADGLRIGQRLSVPWLAHSCGTCRYCRAGRENLCERARFTGYDRDGGYAGYTLADARYCLPLPAGYDHAHAAPLLCAGLIGYRAYAMTGAAHRLGLYGFGAAAHIVAQLASAQGREVYAFTRPGDTRSQQFARTLGAVWAGASDGPAPAPLDAAILFAADGALVPRALAACAKGATVVCAGIHMSDLPSMPYALLWGERSVRSVANLTRADGAAFMQLAELHALRTAPVVYPLLRANDALADLRAGAFDGAAVLVPEAGVTAAAQGW
ncbi:zinc-binding alcohol dehydrogenase family protein [Rugamonas sp. FT107W]|uniref:Zinc-binding alcohol dehydrogenase family protein n=2 Tax=Duganella vulcania TaxID=2692166 RepID=A0A845HDN5_9BURK|nr:zinc-dependent alcohol dehydrogenase family protein [Duganella vulcania]MYN16758.1 zinc-binding alcohol dehydrogenase family protein [Duganella vulcania]